MIDIETGGERYQEMHVDGGTVSQVVLYPPSVGGDNLINEASHGDPRIADAISATGSVGCSSSVIRGQALIRKRWREALSPLSAVPFQR